MSNREKKNRWGFSTLTEIEQRDVSQKRFMLVSTTIEKQRFHLNEFIFVATAVCYLSKKRIGWILVATELLIRNETNLIHLHYYLFKFTKMDTNYMNLLIEQFDII